MPNVCQPQGLVKTVTNPVANDTGKFVLDFDMPEDNGMATASHLALTIDDGATRTDIDIILNPALLRTRFDAMAISVISDGDANLNIYTLTKPEHIDDYAQADKQVIACKANAGKTIIIGKEGDVMLFTDGTDTKRLVLNATPEGGSTVSTPIEDEVIPKPI